MGETLYFKRKKKSQEVVDLAMLKDGTIVWAKVEGVIGRLERVCCGGKAVSLCEYRNKKEREAQKRALTHKVQNHEFRVRRRFDRYSAHALG